MSDLATPTSPVGTSIRLPVATLPAAVLPGSVVTLTLASDELRSAIAAARHEADPRVVLRIGADDTLVVVAQVPDVGNLPTGDPAAVISIQSRARITALHPSGAALAALVG